MALQRHFIDAEGVDGTSFGGVRDKLLESSGIDSSIGKVSNWVGEISFVIRHMKNIRPKWNKLSIWTQVHGSDSTSNTHFAGFDRKFQLLTSQSLPNFARQTRLGKKDGFFKELFDYFPNTFSTYFQGTNTLYLKSSTIVLVFLEINHRKGWRRCIFLRKETSLSTTKL